MVFSKIAAQEREKAAEIRSFLAFGLIGSVALHIGVLGFGMNTLLDRVPELEDEPIELTLIEPPTLEEKLVLEAIEKSPDSSSEEKPSIVSAPSSIAVAPSSLPVVAPRREVVENLKTSIPQQKPAQSPMREIPIQPKPVIPSSPIQSASPAITSRPSVAVNQSLQNPKPNEKLTMELTRNSRASQGIATTSTGLSDKLGALGNASVAPGGMGNRTGSGSGTGMGSGSGSGSGIGAGSGSGFGTGSGGSGTGTGNGNGGGSGSTVATGSRIRQGGNGNGASTGSGGQLACRNCSKPRYPDRARRRGVEGAAKIKVDVDDKGNVTNVQVAQSTGDAELDQAAVRAARRWKFDTPNGARQGVSARVDFALEGSERSRQIRERQRQRAATPRRPSSATESATRTPTVQTTGRSTSTRRVRRNSNGQPAATSLPRRRPEVSTPRQQRVRSQSPTRSQQATPIRQQSRLNQVLRRSLQPSQKPASPSQPANSAP